MKKHILSYVALGLAVFLPTACNDSESDLLKPKVYFENKEYNVEVKEEKATMDVELTCRLSNTHSSEVAVSYSVAEASVVKDYNIKYGTNYQTLDAKDVKLEKSTSVIEKGQLFAGKVKMTLSNLDKLAEGKSYVVPVRLHSGSVPTIEGTDIEYVILAKPITITKVAEFDNNYISVKFPSGTFFKSFTYEALIYPTYLGSNNTVLGTEGIMILRIGDTGGGIPRGIVQAAGRQHYEAPEKLQTDKWYHLALTFDQTSGKTVMYLNGNKWAESAWNIPGFDPNADVGFNIGKLPGFPWGERPFYGYMSEIRVWSVARSENQIKQNMLGVDSKSDGLELYYKLNGTEKVENGTVNDAAKGLGGRTGGFNIKKLDVPVAIN